MAKNAFVLQMDYSAIIPIDCHSFLPWMSLLAMGIMKKGSLSLPRARSAARAEKKNRGRRASPENKDRSRRFTFLTVPSGAVVAGET